MMVCLASESDTAFAPYSNICPIAGWTGAVISHSGIDTSNPETINITFPTEAGTVYGGTLDVTAGKLTVDRKGIIYDGSADEAWNLISASSRAYIVVPDINTTVTDGSIVDIKTNQYKAGSYADAGITRITGRYSIAQINIFDYQYIYVEVV